EALVEDGLEVSSESHRVACAQEEMTLGKRCQSVCRRPQTAPRRIGDDQMEATLLAHPSLGNPADLARDEMLGGVPERLRLRAQRGDARSRDVDAVSDEARAQQR